MMAAADRYADEVCDESCTDAQVAETINDFCAGWREADQHPHWIPVEERLPKETGWYLVATPTLNSKIDVAFWKGKWHRLITITHWMPIVPPRKEAKHDTIREDDGGC